MDHKQELCAAGLVTGEVIVDARRVSFLAPRALFNSMGHKRFFFFTEKDCFSFFSQQKKIRALKRLATEQIYRSCGDCGARKKN